MKKAYSEFKRGDVWFIHLSNEFGDGNKNSSVQKKSRPYLIVSCEENNNAAPIFNCVPLSTQPNDHLPPHVYFKGTNNRDQLILCEQITTLSIHDFNRTGSSFMYSLTIDFMNEVDKALAAQLGLTPRVADMRVLENLIDKLATDKEAELKRKYEERFEAKLSEIADKLAKKFGINLDAQDMLNGVNYRPEQLTFVDKSVRAEMAETIEHRTTPPTTKTIHEPSEPKAVKTPVEDEKTKRVKHKWDEESMKAFLDDYGKLSMTEMSAKWHMTKKSIVTYASTFKKKVKVVKT